MTYKLNAVESAEKKRLKKTTTHVRSNVAFFHRSHGVFVMYVAIFNFYN